MKLLIALLLLPLTASGALSVVDRGATAGPNSSSASIVCSPTSTITAGSTGVLIIAEDNTSSTLSNFPAIGTLVTDSIGNKWRLRQTNLSAVNNALGVETAVYTCSQLVTQMTSSNNVTITFVNGNVTAKTYQFYEVDAAAGNIALPVGSSGNASNSAAPTITTGPVINNGDLIIGFNGIEGTGVAVTGDSDVTGGTWVPTPAATPATVDTSGVGLTGTSGIQINTQYKISTSSTSTQTFNLSWTGALDQIIGWISFTEIDQKGRRVVATAANSTTWAWSPSDSFTAGSLAVLVVAADNAGTTGTAANISSVGDTVNTWTLQFDGINPGTPGINTGAELAIFTAPITGTLDPSSTITVTFGLTTAAKAAVLWEFAATSTPTFVATGDSGTTSTGTPTITTSSITSGDIVIAGGAAEGQNTWLDDTTNVTNGTWMKSGKQAQSTGASTVAVISQYKITTGTGTQTFAPTLTAADVHLGWIQIHPPSVGPTAAQKSSFFMLFP